MKTTLTTLLFISLLGFSINAQTTYVPDDNFEQRLIDLGYDDVLDDYVLTANISGVTYLNITNLSISDATGLEDFASLTGFQCGQNQITSLEFHPDANLDFFICQNNPLTELDLSQHTNLFEFSCTNTNITNLDLSQNTNLRYLYCDGTPLTYLDLSNNISLLEILASDSNFEFVDLRNGNNQEIDDVNFLNNPVLPYIYVDDCNYSTTNWLNIDATTTFVEMEGDTECEPLGVEDFLVETDVLIYPNPVEDVLYLQKNQFMTIEKMELMDLSGKKLKDYQSESSKLDTHFLEPGLYLLKITSDYGITLKRIVKR